MPLYMQIDSQTRRFEVECEGAVGLADIHRMLDMAVSADALDYRKLFEAAGAELRLSTADMMDLGVRLRALQAGMLGPLALVLRDDQALDLSRLLGILAVARRPIKVFRDVPAARKWLDSKPVLRSMSGVDAASLQRATPPVQPGPLAS